MLSSCPQRPGWCLQRLLWRGALWTSPGSSFHFLSVRNPVNPIFPRACSFSPVICIGKDVLSIGNSGLSSQAWVSVLGGGGSSRAAEVSPWWPSTRYRPPSRGNALGGWLCSSLDQQGPCPVVCHRVMKCASRGDRVMTLLYPRVLPRLGTVWKSLHHPGNLHGPSGFSGAHWVTRQCTSRHAHLFLRGFPEVSLT